MSVKTACCGITVWYHPVFAEAGESCIYRFIIQSPQRVGRVTSPEITLAQLEVIECYTLCIAYLPLKTYQHTIQNYKI